MTDFSIMPKVDEAQEFIEIANDFSNPLDLVREAISNAFDAKAKIIKIHFDVIKQYGESVLQITMSDDGTGMDRKGLQAFFDLGNSSRREEPETIGEKGHGTKVYFNSSEIRVSTVRDGKLLSAEMKEPFKRLFDRKIPEVKGQEDDAADRATGTTITVIGYNNNRRDLFTHEILKDHISWFTKFGSFEREAGIENNLDTKLELKGLNRTTPEILEFGHFFPPDSVDVNKLFDKYFADAPKYYAKQITKTGQLKNFPEIKYDAVFVIEGNKIKQDYNPMLRRQGYSAPEGSYTVQERYGLWLSKDYIPVQRANEWIGTRGSEYTRFHAFLNCQDFRLTANRGSIQNTPTEILQDIQREVESLYAQISESADWNQLDWLESQADAYRTTEREKKDFLWRTKKLNQSNVSEFQGHVLSEPSHESGVYGLVVQLATIDKTIFPFEILDYNTHTGIDVIVKSDHFAPLHQSKLYYVEFKYILSKDLNHSFENLQSIICWDTATKHGDTITDINEETRTIHITAPGSDGEYTKYFLDNPSKAHKIEVYVLKDFLKDRYKVEFRPRTDKAVI